MFQPHASSLQPSAFSLLTSHFSLPPFPATISPGVRPACPFRGCPVTVTARLTIASTVVLLAASGPSARQAPPDLEEVLRRAGAYFVDYERRFASVVAEERYVQELRPGAPPAGTRVPEAATLSAALPGSGERPPQQLGWNPMTALNFGNFNPTMPLERRQLVSDYLLVAVEQEVWFAYRDIREVNGTEVAGRENRVMKLLLAPSADALDQMRRLADESARYNIGNVRRTFNLPTLALLFLHPGDQSRLTFTKADEVEVEGVTLWVVRYRETERPTMIHNERGDDVPTTGRYWIEPDTGRVVQTELEVTDLRYDVRGVVVVAYRPDETLGLWMPVEMRERYDHPLTLDKYTDCLAVYSNFRQFKVETSEAIKKRPN